MYDRLVVVVVWSTSPSSGVGKGLELGSIGDTEERGRGIAGVNGLVGGWREEIEEGWGEGGWSEAFGSSRTFPLVIESSLFRLEFGGAYRCGQQRSFLSCWVVHITLCPDPRRISKSSF